MTSFVLDSSGMLSGAVRDLRLLLSMSPVFSVSCASSLSFVGELGLDCDTIQDFLLSLDSDREGDMEVCVSDALRVSLRLRLDSDDSRLLLEKGRNLDDRREAGGFNCGIWSLDVPSSESGAEPSEEEEGRPGFRSSSDMRSLAPTTGSSKSFTRGK
jgi:hypothetical protein